jgi:hypothetical protein
VGTVLRKLSPPSISSLAGVSTTSRASQLLEPWAGVRKNIVSGGPINAHDVLDPGGYVSPTIAQKKQAKQAIVAPQLAADQSLIYKRQRQRASALSTGAGDSGNAPTTSAMAYGKPTLGG